MEPINDSNQTADLKLGKPLRKAEYLLEQMDDELLLYNPDETRVIQFNPTASLIWSLCDGTRSLDEMIVMLVDLYPEAGESIDTDVRSTIAEFDRLGCIEWR